MAVKKTNTAVKSAPRSDSSNSSSVNTLQAKTKFSFYAPEASKVAVAGSFNGWNPEGASLKKGKDGKWTGELKVQPGRHEYRFFVDGQWESDPSVPSVPNEFGSTNCVLEVK